MRLMRSGTLSAILAGNCPAAASGARSRPRCLPKPSSGVTSARTLKPAPPRTCRFRSTASASARSSRPATRFASLDEQADVQGRGAGTATLEDMLSHARLQEWANAGRRVYATSSSACMFPSVDNPLAAAVRGLQPAGAADHHRSRIWSASTSSAGHSSAVTSDERDSAETRRAGRSAPGHRANTAPRSPTAPASPSASNRSTSSDTGEPYRPPG